MVAEHPPPGRPGRARGAGGRAPALWAAPGAAGPVRARLSLPGSKSITNRALVLAALADGPSVITGPLLARDTALMADALTALGADIQDAGPDAAASGPRAADAGAAAGHAWAVHPGHPSGDVAIDVGNAGTVMRFVPPVAALTNVAVSFHGDARARERPVGPLLDALRELGALIDSGAVPFTVRGAGSLAGGAVALDASASSQFVSALLLAAPRFDKGVEVRHEGARLPSAPLIEMTVAMLRDAGAVVETGSRRGGPAGGGADGPADSWRVLPGAVRPRALTVEPDVPNSAPFLAAALVTGGTVIVPRWPARSLQAAGRLLDLLTAMGADCALGDGGLTVAGGGAIRGISADLSDVSEFAPVLAALAALAGSPSRLTGIGHMRRHETDRLAALAGEINSLGGDVAELPDGLEIRPKPLHGGVFASHDDHRLVMCAAVLGLAVPGVRVENAATVGKTFPDFPRMWSAMLEDAP